MRGHRSLRVCSLIRVLSGSEVVDQRGDVPTGPVPAPPGDGYTTVTIDGQDWRSYIAEIDGSPGGRLQVLQSLAPVDQRLSDNRALMAVVSVGAVLARGWGPGSSPA